VFVLLICEVSWSFAELYNHLLDVLEAPQTSYYHLFTLWEKIWKKVTSHQSFKSEATSRELGDKPPTDGGELHVKNVLCIMRR